MYHKYHVKGLILSSLEEGQDNKRVWMLTDHLGLISAKSVSGRSLSSKMRLAIQEYTLGNFSLVYGKGGWRLVGASSDKNYFELMRGYSLKLKAFLNVSNLLKRLVMEQEMGRELFDVVVSFLDFIYSSEEKHVFLAECITVLRVLYRLGFLDKDVSPDLYLQDVDLKNSFVYLPYESSYLVSIINKSLKETGI